MKGIALTISVFLAWFAIAGTYYTCIIKGVCNFDDSSISTEMDPNNSYPNNTSNPTISNKNKDSTIGFADAEKKSENLNTELDSLETGGLRIYDKDILVKYYVGNFKISKNSSEVKTPFGLSNYGFDIAKYMDSTDTKLKVIGYYNQTETITNGIDRANFIKKRLVKLGIPKELINTQFKQGIFDFKYGKFRGGIQFEFQKSDSTITLNAINYDQIVPLKNPALNEKKEESLEDFLANNTKPIVEEKKVEVPVIKKEPKKEIPKITYTIAESSFKNGKFKASRTLRKFLSNNKNAREITLVGFYNLNDSDLDNYQQGLNLAAQVKIYISKKKFITASINTIAEKKKTTNSIKNKGVSLQIIK